MQPRPSGHAPQTGAAERAPPPPPTAVIAIGASAVGLDALERLFDGAPDDTGAAYVVIQHLDPNFRSMMDELLSHHSSLPIRKAETGMEIEPNAIYLNPARQEMTIDHGRFRLLASERAGGLSDASHRPLIFQPCDRERRAWRAPFRRKQEERPRASEPRRGPVRLSAALPA